LFGVVKPFFVGSESGQKQSVKLLQNMVSNTTQQPTHCLHFDFGKRGGVGEVNQREVIHMTGTAKCTAPRIRNKYSQK
jgi:hypothetical protein